MPAIIGPYCINSVSGGTLNMGDSFYISPRETGETFVGSGSLNTGNFIRSLNGVSVSSPIQPVGGKGNIVSPT
ncbi:spore germination protein [Halobacillus massiliensis]|uniref:spore germination protein n=1 Tax=Halobacillus massiliensis TaxID=1926286 RepID=UPI0009E3FE89|nr:spore germination protein [Halobacillus massiliensis]